MSAAVSLVVLLGLSTSLSQGPVISTGTRDDDDGPQSGIGIASEWPLEVGVYYIADYPGTSSDLPNAASNGWGLYNTLRAAGWCNFAGNDCFLWSNANAWEQDFKLHSLGGTNDYWVDDVDLVFYEGHGNPSLFTFKTPTGGGTHDDSYLTYSDARLAWGNRDLEWMSLLSCSVLADSHELDWAWTMDGLHLLLGFRTTAYDVNGFGTRYAQYINAGYRVSLAWMKACDEKQPTGVQAKILAEEYNHFYDTRFYQYPDTWDNDYYRWVHVCGSEPARQVDVNQLRIMPVFETPPLSLAEAQAEFEDLGKAFQVPAVAGASALGEEFWVSTTDGRELQMDVENGLYYYVDHNELFSPTLTSGAQVLAPEDAQQIANTFLSQNGLMPADAQFYEVVNETVQTEVMPQPGSLATQAEVQAEDLVGYQVIYSRILTYTTTAQADPVEFSVVGPGSKLKVYVSPTAGGASVTANGGSVVGAQGGWRSVAPTALGVRDTVPVLPYPVIETLFQELEPEVALSNPPFDNPTSKDILTYTLGYWEESSGLGQDQLFPTWVLSATYEGAPNGEPLVVTDYCYIPANETYMRPLAKIVSHSDLSDITPGTVVTFTAADASKPLNELGYDASLNFALGSGGPYLYDWYLGTVDPAYKIDSGQTLTYTVGTPSGAGHPGPVAQTIILVVTDVGTTHASQNSSTDRAAFDVAVPLAADFTVEPVEGIAPLTVSFGNLSSGDWDTCAWDLGDGTSSTDCGGVDHTYAPGTYTVSLEISGSGGIDEEIKANVVVARHGVYLPLVLRQ